MLRHHLIVSACAVASFAVVTPSMASLVSVTGGFTSFESTVIDRTSVPSMLNGAPICATAGCSTTGDAFVNFSTPISKLSFDVGDVPNSVRFEAAAPQEVTGTGPASPFLLGRFFYENGIWSGDATFGFTLTTKSSDPLLD